MNHVTTVSTRKIITPARMGLLLMLLALLGWTAQAPAALAGPDGDGDKAPRLDVNSTTEAPLTLTPVASPADCECKGGLISLTLLYKGDSGTLVVTAGGKKGKKGKKRKKKK